MEARLAGATERDMSGVRVGVMLPTFEHGSDAAVATARRAEEVGLDGVFVFDHLWPMGQPDRPALSAWPMLGAVAAETATVHLGPLVARIGLLPDPVLVASAKTLATLAGPRVIAALGTGDRLSADENRSYGVDTPPARDRRLSLERCARELVSAGVSVWVGVGSAEGSPATRAVARATGAAVNMWGTSPADVAAEAVSGEVTWGGPLPEGVGPLTAAIEALALAGASWVVCARPYSLDDVAAAADEVRRRRTNV